MNELISVILPVYNGREYLSEAIESILNQTYTNFEFIIINDGSKDDSLQIIKEYERKDERIVVISRENKGLISTLNEGIANAKGKYIARMDQDDISLPRRFEEQIKFLEKNLEIGVCGTWVEVFGDNRNPILWKMPINDDELKVRLLFSVTFAHPSVMMRKGLINQYNLRYNEKYINAEDYKFWLDFSKYTKFVNIPKVLFRYRYLETSISRVADNAKDEHRYKTISSIFKEVLDELNIKNTEEENRLHFTIGLNERISKVDINLKLLNSYLNKLIDANKKKQVFNQKYLEQFLAKKFLIVVYYKIKKRDFSFFGAIFYNLFWLASKNIIKDRLG
ncbi:glycosyltransferase family 2 protein [Aliarcobacter butzleri]|uniref:glycosyltransferase family 2 protein n=1 Tax=Aliarcobacter butzleri TaxID=28197 RepID=UPI003AF8814D